MPADGERGSRKRGRVEPWPWIIAVMLCSMIGASLTFYAIAASNPDPVLVDDAYEASRRFNEALRER